jgi:sugar phosphate isomerase/epimerase
VHVAVGDYVAGGLDSDSFARARALGADGVELRFGPQDIEHHALLQAGMSARLRSQARAAGILVPSVYAGYIASHPLSDPDTALRSRHAAVVANVVEAAAEVGARVIVIPLFGAAEPRDERDVTALGETLRPLADRAATAGLTLGLESALPVTALFALLKRVDHPAVCVAYDLGTGAAIGQDPVAALKLLDGAVCQLRIRDCSRAGQRVVLGQGAVAEQWPAIRQVWAAADSERWCVLEVPAGSNPVEWARAELAFLRG